MSSDQYFLPLLLLHHNSRARLAALLGITAESGGNAPRERGGSARERAAGEGATWDDGKLEGLLVRFLGKWLLRPVASVRRAALAFEAQLQRDEVYISLSLSLSLSLARSLAPRSF